MAEIETPLCKYYTGGVCLYLRDFPQESIPTQATHKPVSPSTAEQIAADLNIRTGTVIYFCRGTDVAKDYIGTYQRDKCNKYTPQIESQAISLK